MCVSSIHLPSTIGATMKNKSRSYAVINMEKIILMFSMVRTDMVPIQTVCVIAFCTSWAKIYFRSSW